MRNISSREDKQETSLSAKNCQQLRPTAPLFPENKIPPLGGEREGQNTVAKVVGKVWAAVSGGGSTLFIFSVAIPCTKTRGTEGPDKRGPRNFAASDKLACHTAALVPDRGNIFIERLAANGNPGVPSPALFSSTRLSLSGPRDRCSFFFFLFIYSSLPLSLFVSLVATPSISRPP